MKHECEPACAVLGNVTLMGRAKCQHLFFFFHWILLHWDVMSGTVMTTMQGWENPAIAMPVSWGWEDARALVALQSHQLNQAGRCSVLGSLLCVMIHFLYFIRGSIWTFLFLAAEALWPITTVRNFHHFLPSQWGQLKVRAQPSHYITLGYKIINARKQTCFLKLYKVVQSSFQKAGSEQSLIQVKKGVRKNASQSPAQITGSRLKASWSVEPGTLGMAYFHP